MKYSHNQAGFALALLLWTIAGMSLMVTAVIHFARDDTAMVELRLKEAKSLAISRGAALLAVRDRAYSKASPERLDSNVEQGESGENIEQQGFSAQYQFPNVGLVRVRIRPGSGYVSLNNASAEELTVMFSGLGEVPDYRAEQMAQAVLKYRDGVTSEAGDRTLNSGFHYTEELLSVQGVGRGVYDKVRRYVHPYQSGAINAAAAPDILKALFSEAGDGPQNSSGGAGDAVAADGSGGAGGLPTGLITFDSIWERKRQEAGGGGGVAAVEVTVVQGDGSTARRRVWVSSAGSRVERAEPALFTAEESSRNAR